MKVPRSECGAISCTMLCCASSLVFRSKRSDWLQEWRSELWYVCRALREQGCSGFEVEKQATVFCLGAFRDAWCVRRQSKNTVTRPVRTSRSAMMCTAILALLVTLSVSTAWLLPNVRTVTQSWPYKGSREIVVLSPSGAPSQNVPLIRMKQFRVWQRRSRHMFSTLGFYEPVTKPVLVGSHYTQELTVARASANLFAMLGVRPSLAIANATEFPTLFVSESVWQRDFHGDTNLLGSTVEVGLRKARLVGIVSKAQWRLPGRFDAWLLEPGFDAPAITDNSRGFVVARLIPSARNFRLGERWTMSAPQPNGDMSEYACIAVSAMERAPFGIYVFTVLLALLALPATTSLPLGEYPVSGDQVSWSIRLRRWMFLAVKFSLILPTVYYGSLDLAHAATASPLTAEYIQIVSSFLMALFGFRWALRDQRKRCPVCLCTLTHPARVGQPSRNFLAWHGTELICAGGHGLLHVPELPTSWFATQRWLYLDPSWSALFPQAV